MSWMWVDFFACEYVKADEKEKKEGSLCLLVGLFEVNQPQKSCGAQVLRNGRYQICWPLIG